MKKMNAKTAALFTAALSFMGIASAPSSPKPTADHSGIPAITHPGASSPDRNVRHKALIDRYARSARKLDSLERNALSRGGEDTVYSRLLRQAHTRRDHTQFAFDLLGYADTTDPTAWEVARARAQDSLDSLDRSIRMAQEDTLRPASPRPPPSGRLQKGGAER